MIGDGADQPLIAAAAERPTRPSEPRRSSKPLIVSRTHLRKTLDESGESFRTCWQAIKTLKSPSADAEAGAAVVGFQTRLVEPIVALEALYREIHQERKRRVAHKATYNARWFTKRMAQLDGYRKAVVEALAIGRALGDAFAWFFYERDRDLITEHLKHQRQPLLPPGDGGLGERLTAQGLQGLDGQFLLLHGLTTFLRMGDVSFIDLKTVRVASIGELKTQRVGDRELSVTLHLIAGDKSQLPKISESKRRTGPAQPLWPKAKMRLDTQVKKMSAAYRAARSSTPDFSIGTPGQFHFDALREVVEMSHTRHMEFVQAGPSMVLGAIRLSRSPALSKRLIGEGKKPVDRLVQGATKWAIKIMDRASKDNQLILDSIGGAESIILTDEAQPLLWWPCPDDTLYDILFGHVLVVSFYNPAHFFAKLRERGFELSIGPRGRILKATRTVNGKEQYLQHFDYFQRLIQRSLMTEETIARMIDETFALVKNTAGQVRVNIRPRVC